MGSAITAKQKLSVGPNASKKSKSSLSSLCLGAALGVAYEPLKQRRVGQEDLSIALDGLPIPMVSVDALTTMSGWSEPIDMPSIDTEGHDSYVLDGATSGIGNKTFRVIEFEYHRMGAWAVRSLNTTVSTLARSGYSCYWQGTHGKLARFEFSCNNQIRKWSNLVCAHEPHILSVFDALR